MNPASITFRIDDEVKKQAERIFYEMGLSTSAALNVFMKAVVRTGKMPFELVSDEYAIRERIARMLDEAEACAKQPDTV